MWFVVITERAITAANQQKMTQKEFVQLVTPFKDKIYRLAKRILVSSDEAEDAVQEVLLKLWKGRDRIVTYKKPEAFAMTMTKNYCLDRLKSKQAGHLTIVHSSFTASKERLQDQIEANDGVSLVFKIMDTLPEQQKLVLQLRDIEHYEFKEIAQILEMNETAVRVTLSRARKAIRQELTKQYNYGVS